MKVKKEQNLSGVFIFIVLALIGVVVAIAVTSGKPNDIRSQAAISQCDPKQSVYSCINNTVGSNTENGKTCVGIKKLENNNWKCIAIMADVDPQCSDFNKPGTVNPKKGCKDSIGCVWNETQKKCQYKQQ